MNLYLSAYAGGGHYNDMDMLEIGRGLTRGEEETHFGMWCIMSSPLLIGCDLTTVPEASLELLTNDELIALNQDPLGLQAYIVQHERGGYVLVKDIEQKRGRARAVALYNPTDNECQFEVPVNILEFEGAVKVRDLVKRKDEGRVKETIKYRVSAHGVKILRVEGEKRTDPVRYEAEQAYLNQYDALLKRPRAVAYQSFEGASGDMTICNLGGHKDNYAEWNEVYSSTGGKYKLKIHYVPAGKREREIEDRRMEVTVNGNRTTISELETDRGKGVSVVEIPVELNKGYNVVRIGSRYTWSPDLDYLVVEAVE